MNDLVMVLSPLLAVSIGLPQPRPSIRIQGIPAQLPGTTCWRVSLCISDTRGSPGLSQGPQAVQPVAFAPPHHSHQQQRWALEVCFIPTQPAFPVSGLGPGFHFSGLNTFFGVLL